MRTLTNSLLAGAAAALLLTGVAVTPDAGASSAVEQGKAIAMDRKKGNCMSCHVLENAALPGNVGPPLIAMKQRFPDKAALRAQIYDSTKKNPQSMMPPFGRHGVLSNEEIDLIVEYLYTL
jgi:sulfur-oxidizing protein SoxX